MQNLLEMICEKENIYLDAWDLSNTSFGGGFAMKIPGGEKGIAYDDTLEGWRKYAVIAHEIAHHVLGHFDDETHMFENYGDNNPKKQKNELEAQVFSAVFTAMAMFMEYSQKDSPNIGGDSP
jgi:hypothetical protein